MFNTGDKVKAIPSQLHSVIAEMLDGKIGTVTDITDEMREIVVHFPGTGRPGGLFAMDYSQVENVK